VLVISFESPAEISYIFSLINLCEIDDTTLFTALTLCSVSLQRFSLNEKRGIIGFTGSLNFKGTRCLDSWRCLRCSDIFSNKFEIFYSSKQKKKISAAKIWKIWQEIYSMFYYNIICINNAIIFLLFSLTLLLL